MTQEEALKVIEDHQAWRKGGDAPQTDPTKLTEALDLLPKLIESKDREIAELDEQLQLQHDHIKELKTEIERLKQDASQSEVKYFELEKQFRNGQEELESAAKEHAVNHSNAPDKETPDWIISDFKAGAMWVFEKF